MEVIDARTALRQELLIDCGFSDGEIAQVREKIPDLNVIVLEVPAGFDIGRAARAACDGFVDSQQFAEPPAAVVFKFNTAVLMAGKDDSVASICGAFDRHLEAARNARYNPERMRVQAEEQEKHNSLLASHMEALRGINFADPVEPLKWLCKLEEVGGYTYSEYDRSSVLGAFAEAGYTPGMNCGIDFNGEDQENFKGYIIGHALRGIQSEGSPHQVIHRFTAEYEEKFGIGEHPTPRLESGK